MRISQIPFETIDWSSVEAERKFGESGWADWKVRQFGDIRVRMLEYSPGYRADHWCAKGHILFCFEGEMVTQLRDGREFVLRAGSSYHVADEAEAHRTYTKDGAKLFIVD
jgi:quercetin dioxygenase-like cupin family protein